MYMYTLFNYFFNVHLSRGGGGEGGGGSERERERERASAHEQGRGRERERDTASTAGSRLWAVSTEPNAGLELTNREIMA